MYKFEQILYICINFKAFSRVFECILTFFLVYRSRHPTLRIGILPLFTLKNGKKECRIRLIFVETNPTSAVAQRKGFEPLYE